MSRISQFINFSPVDNKLYDNTVRGEIKILPQGLIGNTTFDSNNYIRAGQVLNQSEYSSLYSQIGLTSAYSVTPKNNSMQNIVKRYDSSVSANIFYTHAGFDIRKFSANGYFSEVVATLPFRDPSSSSSEPCGHSFIYSEQAGYFLTAGELGNLARSTDAITWQISSNTQTQTTTRFTSITYGNGLYIAVGDNSLYRSSTDFITWDYFPNITANNTAAIYASTYGNGVYVEGGLGGFIQTSTDGRSWTTRTSGTTSDINGLTYGNGVFVYTGNGGVLGTSTNGVTWTSRASGTTSNIRAIVYGNSRWVWCGNTGALGYATSSTSWSTASSGTTTNLTAITYGNGIFLAAGIAATTLTSTNGVSWTLRLNSTAGTYVGSTEYLSPGTYSWIAPANVTSVSVVAVGSGAGGTSILNDLYQINGQSSSHQYSSGGGGGLAWKNNITVVPGNTYTVVVGTPGQGQQVVLGSGTYNLASAYGETSYFQSKSLVAGGGGGQNDLLNFPSGSWQFQNPPNSGGNYIGDGGGNGGSGAWHGESPVDYPSPWHTPSKLVSGAGAGGYSGSGGTGTRYYSANGVLDSSGWYGQPQSGSGGGSGGSSGGSRGGGVGVFGKGVDGNSLVGFGGSGGDTQGNHGGGGGQNWSGGPGAVRIVWGPGRAYPATAVGNVATVAAGGDPAVSLSYGNGLFVYTSELGRYLTSTNGIVWETRNPPSTVTIRTSTYGNGKYFYGDDRGDIYYNTNLANSLSWIKSSNSTIDRIHTSLYNNGTYIFAGANTTENGKSIVTTNGFVGLNIKFPQESNYRVAYFDPYWNTFAIGGQYRQTWGVNMSQEQDPWLSNFRYSSDGSSWLPNSDIFKYYGGSTTGGWSTTINSIDSSVSNTQNPANNRFLIIVGSTDTHGSLFVHSNTSSQTFSGGFRGVPNTQLQTANSISKVKVLNFNTVYLLGQGNFLSQGSVSQWGYSGSPIRINSSPDDIEQKSSNVGGGFILSAGTWSGTSYSSNSLYTTEYSPLYNVQSQFILPFVSGIPPKNNFSPSNFSYSFLNSSSNPDYINTANTFYENVYVRVK